jgi:hypothetical protein
VARYWAQLDGNVVQRVIACDDAAWIASRLGGTWVETFIDDPVEQYAGPGFGWDDGSQYRFAPQWVQPLAAEDAYQPGAYVFHAGAIWQCVVVNCVWEPGVFGLARSYQRSAEMDSTAWCWNGILALNAEV